MEEWKEYKLGDVLTIKYGKDHKQIADGDIPIYGSGGIMRYGERSLYEGPSILIPRKGSLNNIMYSDKPFWTVDTMFWTIINKEVANPLFVYYSICKKDFASLNVGSAVPSLTVPVIEDIEIILPSKTTQDKIVAILKSLDDKIELNRRINDNLEQQAQALFKSWFVDFEPFRDQPFVESELGMIPEGWRVMLFKDVCDTITDGVHNTVKDDINGKYYLLSCKNIKGGQISIGNSERKINREVFEKLRKRTNLQKGDILLSSVGTIGEIVLLNESPYNYEFQRSVAMIKPNTNLISPHFLYYTMKVQKDNIIHSAHGAVQQCLFISDIANFKTICPPYNIIQHFTNIVFDLHDMISKNREESRRLAELRDTLLPRLMSGELLIK